MGVLVLNKVLWVIRLLHSWPCRTSAVMLSCGRPSRPSWMNLILEIRSVRLLWPCWMVVWERAVWVRSGSVVSPLIPSVVLSLLRPVA